MNSRTERRESGQRWARWAEAPGTLLTQSAGARQEELLPPYPLDDGPLLLAAEGKQVLGDARAIVEDDVLGGEGQAQEVAVHRHRQGLLRSGHLPDDLHAVLVHQEHLDGSALDGDDADLHAEGVSAHRVLVQGEGRGPLDAGTRGHGLQAQHVDQGDGAVTQHQQAVEGRRRPQLIHRLLETQVSVQLLGGRERGRPAGHSLLLQQEAVHEAVAGAHVQVPAAALHALQGHPLPVAHQLLPLDGGDQGEGLGAHHVRGWSAGEGKKGKSEEQGLSRTISGHDKHMLIPSSDFSERKSFDTVGKKWRKENVSHLVSSHQANRDPGRTAHACF